MSPIRLAKFETGMRMVLDFNEAFNRHDVPGMMVMMSEDCIFENTYPAPDGTRFSGKQEISRYWEQFFLDSPRAHIEIEEIFGLGFHCVLRWKYMWENPGGTKGHVRGVDVFKFKDGLICEKLSYVKG